MPFNFLSLVNDVNARLNEVPLTEANFNSAGGWYSQAKEAVNSAIRDINMEDVLWPWNFIKQEEVLVPGQVKYSYPTNAQWLSFDTFRVRWDTPNSTRRLLQKDYEHMLELRPDIDSLNVARGIPEIVFRYPDLSYGIYPSSNDTHTLIYDYYSLPPSLEEAMDVPFIPEQWRHCIINGAMYHAFIFRGDPEGAVALQQKFIRDIKVMRRNYENRYEYVRSGYIWRY